MSYGPQRFMANNFLDSVDKVTADTQAGGAVSLAELTTGTGSAVMWAVGPFTGEEGLTYWAIIDDVSAGVSVGQATFKWRNSNTSGWAATGVTTSATPIALNLGVQVAWNASATADDFALGDTNILYTKADFGTANLFDLDANTVFRSEAVDNLVFDLGSPQNVKVLILKNHNITAGNLQAHTSDLWTSPSYDEALVIADPLIFYLDETYEFWRLNPTAASDAYVEIGELYIGDYLQLTNNAWWNSVQGHGYRATGQESLWGVSRQQALAQQQPFTLKYDRIKAADILSLIAMQESLVNTDTTGKINPLFVHLFSDDTSSVILADWVNIAEFEETHLPPGYNTIPDLVFREKVVVRV